MARTGQTQASDASKATSAQQTQAFNTEQGAIGDYQANIKKLDSGGSVGANPYMDAGYLGNINKLRAGTLDAVNDEGKTALNDLNVRTGGMGDSATRYGISNLALQKMRLSDQLGAQQAAGDYDKNLSWQQYLAQAPLQAAGAEGGAYGTATSGNSAANSTLSQFGLASYGPWNSLIGAVGGAAGGALSAGGALAPHA